MLWVVNLGNTPRVDPGTDGLAIDLDLLLRTNDGEGHSLGEDTGVLRRNLVVGLDGRLIDPDTLHLYDFANL